MSYCERCGLEVAQVNAQYVEEHDEVQDICDDCLSALIDEQIAEDTWNEGNCNVQQAMHG